MRRWCLLACLAIPTLAGAQEPTSPTPHPPATPVAAQERVDVVAVTPLHGSGLPRLHLPSNVQVLVGDRLWPGSTDVAALLAAGAGSLHVSEAQGGSFQPDLVFRGFVGSPLLGASEGLALFIDGVRANEPFGDVINWDALPPFGLASLNVMPGSNPMFGLNTLGGALSVRTRDGFEHRGGRASVLAGAFGRRRADADIGGQRGAWAGYVAGSWLDEDGWRDFSPSTMRRVFGKVSWRDTSSRIDISSLNASNDLIGNGAAPIGLLERDRSAVFTHPDRTDHDLAGLTLRADRFATPTVRLEAVSYYRRTHLGTLNGDAADDGEGQAVVAADGGEDEAVLNRSRTRSHARGATLQLVTTSPLRGRANHLVVGTSADVASSRFGFAAEIGTLAANRGALGTGRFDEDAAVGLRTRTRTVSLFASDTLEVTPTVHATVAARANWTAVTLRDQLGSDLDGDHEYRRLNPSAGLTWDVAGWLNIFGGYSESSRVPTAVELTCADPEDPCRLPNAFVSDPPLEAPVAATWEGGARGLLRHGTWNLAVFRTQVKDDLIFVSSGPRRGEGHFENVTRTLRQGLEADVEWRVRRLTLSGSYTWQRATYADAFTVPSRFHPDAQDQELAVSRGDSLPGVPTHVARVGALMRATSRLELAASWRARSGQVYRGDEANRLDRLGGSAVLDTRLLLRVARRVSLVAQLDNVWNREYATFGTLGSAALLGETYAGDPRFVSPAPPRAGWMGFEIAF